MRNIYVINTLLLIVVLLGFHIFIKYYSEKKVRKDQYRTVTLECQDVTNELVCKDAYTNIAFHLSNEWLQSYGQEGDVGFCLVDPCTHNDAVLFYSYSNLESKKAANERIQGPIKGQRISLNINGLTATRFDSQIGRFTSVLIANDSTVINLYLSMNQRRLQRNNISEDQLSDALSRVLESLSILERMSDKY